MRISGSEVRFEFQQHRFTKLVFLASSGARDVVESAQSEVDEITLLHINSYFLAGSRSARQH